MVLTWTPALDCRNGYVFLLRGKLLSGEANTGTEEPGAPALLLDAFDGGNSACMINDYRANPFADAATEESLAGQAQYAAATGPNVGFCKVFDRGWPHLFIVSISELNAGDELLLDYGEAYWESRRDACLGAKNTVPSAHPREEE